MVFGLSMWAFTRGVLPSDLVWAFLHHQNTGVPLKWNFKLDLLYLQQCLFLLSSEFKTKRIWFVAYMFLVSLMWITHLFFLSVIIRLLQFSCISNLMGGFYPPSLSLLLIFIGPELRVDLQDFDYSLDLWNLVSCLPNWWATTSSDHFLYFWLLMLWPGCAWDPIWRIYFVFHLYRLVPWLGYFMMPFLVVCLKSSMDGQ